MYPPLPSTLTPILHHFNPMHNLTCYSVPFILSHPQQLYRIGSLHLPAILWEPRCCGQRYKILYFLVTELTLHGMFYGGCAALHWSGRTWKLLEKLTVVPLFKFPTFNYNLPLCIVFNNIHKFDVIVIWESLVCLHCWLDFWLCGCVSVWLFLGARIGNYHHYFFHSTSSLYRNSSGTRNAWHFPPYPTHHFVAWCCNTHWKIRLWQTALLCSASDAQYWSVCSSVVRHSARCHLRTCHLRSVIFWGWNMDQFVIL